MYVQTYINNKYPWFSIVSPLIVSHSPILFKPSVIAVQVVDKYFPLPWFIPNHQFQQYTKHILFVNRTLTLTIDFLAFILISDFTPRSLRAFSKVCTQRNKQVHDSMGNIAVIIYRVTHLKPLQPILFITINQHINIQKIVNNELIKTCVAW